VDGEKYNEKNSGKAYFALNIGSGAVLGFRVRIAWA